MGISGLTSLLKKVSPNSIIIKKLYDYTGKSIAIDTSLFMHKFMYSYGNLIIGFFDQIYHLRRRGIRPIYIFDGKPPVEKNRVLKSRQNAKARLNTRIGELQNKLTALNNQPTAPISTLVAEPPSIKEDTDIVTPIIPTVGEQPIPEIPKLSIEEQKKEISTKLKKLSRHVIKLTKDDFRNIRQLFNLLNVPYYDAEGEADTLCVNLTKNKLADACMTEDMDFLTHGCLHLIRDFNRRCNVVTEYNLPTILKDLNITHNQFVDICILCGCDYTCKIRGLGPVGALKLIREHNDIETIIEKLCGEDKRYKLPENFNYQNARTLFNSSNNTLNYKSFHTKEVKLTELKEFLIKHTKLTSKQINNRFKKIF